MIVLFLTPQDNMVSALNQLINAANTLGPSTPIALFSEPKANVADGINLLVKKINAAGLGPLGRQTGPQLTLVDALNRIVNELNALGGGTPAPTPTPAGMTWGDGTQVTSGDGTPIGWSAP